MDYLANIYKFKAEQLQERLNFLKSQLKQLNEAAEDYVRYGSPEWNSMTDEERAEMVAKAVENDELRYIGDNIAAAHEGGFLGFGGKKSGMVMGTGFFGPSSGRIDDTAEQLNKLLTIRAARKKSLDQQKAAQQKKSITPPVAPTKTSTAPAISPDDFNAGAVEAGSDYIYSRGGYAQSKWPGKQEPEESTTMSPEEFNARAAEAGGNYIKSPEGYLQSVLPEIPKKPKSPSGPYQQGFDPPGSSRFTDPSQNLYWQRQFARMDREDRQKEQAQAQNFGPNKVVIGGPRIPTAAEILNPNAVLVDTRGDPLYGQGNINSQSKDPYSEEPSWFPGPNARKQWEEGKKRWEEGKAKEEKQQETNKNRENVKKMADEMGTTVDQLLKDSPYAQKMWNS